MLLKYKSHFTSVPGLIFKILSNSESNSYNSAKKFTILNEDLKKNIISFIIE